MTASHFPCLSSMSLHFASTYASRCQSVGRYYACIFLICADINVWPCQWLTPRALDFCPVIKMQSILQYRRIGRAVDKQLAVEQNLEKGKSADLANLHPASQHPIQSSIPPARPESATDLEEDGIDSNLGRVGTIASVKTQYSRRTALGHALNGIHARDRTTNEGKGSKVFVVGWEGEQDPLNPRNWSVLSRLLTTILLGSISFIVGVAASADTSILPQAASEFGVSSVVESLAIGTSHIQTPYCLPGRFSFCLFPVSDRAS